MRFYKPKQGEVRTVSYFALLPIRIDNETRWLEEVRVRQIFNRGIWEDIGFVD